MAALLVFVYHFAGDFDRSFGSPFSGTPVWRLTRTWSGEFGVSVFVVLSGLVLVWAWDRHPSAAAFLGRRARALYPLYWWIAVPLIGLALVFGKMMMVDVWKVPFWLSGAGIVSRATFFPVVDAWWYMTLAVQLVLVLPMLVLVRNRVGHAALFAGSTAVALGTVLLARNTGLSYLALGLFTCRLFEFTAGMWLGGITVQATKARPDIGAAGIVVLGATVVTFAVPGVFGVRALALLAVAATITFVPSGSGALARVAVWAGALSYAFYLSHSPWASIVLGALADHMGAAPGLP